MPIYRQTVKFERSFQIEAKDAESANAKLREAVHQCEWDADVENQGFYDFEDEPVQCPACRGACVIGEDERDCERCAATGAVPFSSAEGEDGESGLVSQSVAGIGPVPPGEDAL
jgi:hypothetical protein